MANYIESASAGHQRPLFCAIWRGLVIYPPVVLVLHPRDQRVTQAFAGPLCDGPQPRRGGAGRGGSGSQGYVGSRLRSGVRAPPTSGSHQGLVRMGTSLGALEGRRWSSSLYNRGKHTPDVKPLVCPTWSLSSARDGLIFSCPPLRLSN